MSSVALQTLYHEVGRGGRGRVREMKDSLTCATYFDRILVKPTGNQNTCGCVLNYVKYTSGENSQVSGCKWNGIS